MERLDKIISATGKKSRREVREMVRQGRVLVDGKPAPAADMKVDPQTAVSRWAMKSSPTSCSTSPRAS